jgi:7-cyano-7-deazaguanine synthase
MSKHEQVASKKLAGKKAVVVLSGGIDSTVVLHQAVKVFQMNVIGLYIHYGSNHYKKEYACAKRQCKLLKVPFYEITFDLTSVVKSDLLVTGNKRRLKNAENSVVPFRNTFLLTLAAAFGDTYFRNPKELFILIGTNSSDYAVYRDCRNVFLDSVEKTINLGSKSTDTKFIIYAPLLQLSKTEIIKLGAKLRVPFEHTWTCYKGTKRPCMQCASCQSRSDGFKSAGLHDPLEIKTTSDILNK